MIVVAGWIEVSPARRAAYLAGCVAVVEAARGTAGCLDYALSPDLVDPARINVFERWADRASLDRFRAGGPPDDQLADIRAFHVREDEVSG